MHPERLPQTLSKILALVTVVLGMGYDLLCMRARPVVIT